MAEIYRYNMQNQFHLLGRRTDIPRLTAALDIASSSSSYGEAFPIVIGEAMSCEVPCVATDVGDSAVIVGDTGIVVPAKYPKALSDGWQNLLKFSRKKREKLGEKARKRILDNFSIEAIVRQYESLYVDVINK